MVDTTADENEHLRRPGTDHDVLLALAAAIVLRFS